MFWFSDSARRPECWVHPFFRGIVGAVRNHILVYVHRAGSGKSMSDARAPYWSISRGSLAGALGSNELDLLRGAVVF